MAESRAVRSNCGGQTAQGRAAKILARQVLDARRSRDCLEDLQIVFNEDAQAYIQGCASIRAVDATVEDVNFIIQSVPLNDGCYTVDCNFIIRVRCNVFLSGSDEPIELTGRTSFLKRSVLFGGCGGIQTFSSDGSSSQDLPIATVQVSEPVVLQIFITDDSNGDTTGQPDSSPSQNTRNNRAVFATIGVFSVISLERNIQLTIPVLRAGAPLREFPPEDFNEDPCQLFRRTAFPTFKFCP
jgi:hypothetical protein